ncbi:Putative LOC101732012 (Silurana) [Caligus rogercresseyi]|uniref:RNA-directed DNA polymerase n=1 Tax=Caligus rogercresseyi TaxID=217165 RepID=A0A7T8KFW9_CALRO|nr:Putative LOC101732012 (Silurana) [Caligus rogercresseyi]
MKALARCKFWWPGIFGDIEDKVSTCKTCQENSPSPPSEFTPFEPSVEWERVHIDYAKINGRDVLVRRIPMIK